MREEVLYEKFLDIHKVYYAMDRDMCFKTLEGYGVRPWALYMLRQYWSHLIMVARAGGYYVAPLKGY